MLEIFIFGLVWRMKVSLAARLAVLRASRIMCVKAREAKEAATWLPMPGPEPNTTSVRLGVDILCWCCWGLERYVGEMFGE